MKNTAFGVKVNGKLFDYRIGAKLNLNEVREFFAKKYKIRKIWSGGRHVYADLLKSEKKCFLKLSTTEGISAVGNIERDWNAAFNKLNPRSGSKFWVPENINSGFFQKKFFYLITDKFDGRLFADFPKTSEVSQDFLNNIDKIIDFSQIIESLKIDNVKRYDAIKTDDWQDWFIQKTQSWFNDVPDGVIKTHKLEVPMILVKRGVSFLEKKPRHGDFAPWHLFMLKDGRIGLVDGEHAKVDSVEYYDIGYFIQRVFSVLKNTKLAYLVISKLVKRNYDIKKLKVILTARAIGGYLDESLADIPDYTYATKFKNWVMSL